MMRQMTHKSVDIYRLIAMLLVMWDHLITTSMYAIEIPGVISNTLSKPIIELTGNKLDFLGSFLFYKLHTQSSTLGVVMFLICTGYLIPSSLERYQRKEFLVNRFFRIFPTLFVATVLWGAIAFLSQGLSFSTLQYVSSITLSYQLFEIAPFMGVLWTLVIEVLFYIIAVIAGRIDKNTVVFLYILIICAGLLYREFPNSYTFNFFYDFRYIGFILLGSTIFLMQHAEKPAMAKMAAAIGMSFSANLLIFQKNRDTFGDETTYPNFFSHFIPVLLFLLLIFLEEKLPNIYVHIPQIAYSISQLVYPIYLTHVCIGLTCMYWLSQWGINRYINVLVGFTVSVMVGKLIAVLVEKPFVKLSRNSINWMRAKGSDRTGQDRTGQDRTGQDRTGQDRTGQDRTGQDRTGQT